MRFLPFTVTFLCLWGSLPAAIAQDCKLAATPVEKAICTDPGLSETDAVLNRLYGELRPQFTVKARMEFVAQQRAWLAQRNRSCVTGGVECLQRLYRSRIDQLQALKATAQATDGKLESPDPVVVKGRWKATAIQDPAATAAPDGKSVSDSLAADNLPSLGALVIAAPGTLCRPPNPCEQMGWTQKKLADVNGSSAIVRDLSLNPTLSVLVGSSGSIRSHYLLVPKPDGVFWAVFTLCGPNPTNCRMAAEVWSPVVDAPSEPTPPRP